MTHMHIISSVPFVTLILCHMASAADPIATVNAEYPGGNIVVVENRGEEIEVKPRLDGGRDWFYWNLEATALKAGTVTFVFPPALAKHKNGAVGNQGPAISIDGGDTWQWMGNGTAVVQGRSFQYTFKTAGESVRLAVAIPYLQKDFSAFAESNAANPHFKTSVLNRTRKGREVELVQIGEAHSNAKAVLFTARHHACETIASYFLEGIMEEAMSDSPDGKRFRENYVLYVVPFVDKDGCEDGDQGKGRSPHDHNRDYGPKSIYPTVQAIMQLGEEKDIRASMDFHCPTLVYPDHQVLYFAGPTDVPAHNHETVRQLAKHLKEALPEGSPSGPLVWMKKADDERWTHNNGHFARRPNCLVAATLEIPFAPKNSIMTVDAIRSYGKAFLRAWNATEFGGTGPE
ncbi:MAG: M14 family zinc carboxypeptidase [Pirellulaceae bacterium]